VGEGVVAGIGGAVAVDMRVGEAVGVWVEVDVAGTVLVAVGTAGTGVSVNWLSGRDATCSSMPDAFEVAIIDGTWVATD